MCWKVVLLVVGLPEAVDQICVNGTVACQKLQIKDV